MKIEWWKFIPGYSYKYMVSDKGRVLSLNYNHTGKVKILRQTSSPNGYLAVHLHEKGKSIVPRIHRLVALAFLPIPEHLKHLPLDKIEVNHKDENKENNCVENLEWCDRKYNRNYGTATERQVKSSEGKKINHPNLSEPINQYTLDGVFVAWYPSVAEAVRQLAAIGIKTYSSNIIACCKGYKHHNTAAGFKWSYA